MRKITKEEAKGFTLKKGSSSPVRTALLTMQVGEILLIEKRDWKAKDGPAQMVTRLSRQTGMHFSLDIIASGAGWLVERVK